MIHLPLPHLVAPVWKGLAARRGADAPLPSLAAPIKAAHQRAGGFFRSQATDWEREDLDLTVWLHI